MLFWTKKNHYTIKIFTVYKFQRSPAPLMGIWICTTAERMKRWAFRKFHSGEALDRSNCSSYSVLFWNNLTIFFLFDTVWKVSKYGVFSGLYFSAFGLNTERYFLFLRIQSEYGKIRTRKYSVFGHFSHNVILGKFQIMSMTLFCCLYC